MGRTVGKAIVAVLGGDAPPFDGEAEISSDTNSDDESAEQELARDLAQLVTVRTDPTHPIRWQRLNTETPVDATTPTARYTAVPPEFRDALIAGSTDGGMPQLVTYTIEAHAPITLSIMLSVNSEKIVAEQLRQAGWSRQQARLRLQIPKNNMNCSSINKTLMKVLSPR